MFRRFRPEDSLACLALLESNTPEFFHPSERADFEAFLVSGPGTYFVLEAGERLVACGGVALYPDLAAGIALTPASAGLTWGMVGRAHHGRGLGARLLHERAAWVRDHAPGVNELCLATTQVTRGYYERHGFRVRAVVPEGFAPGLDLIDMHRSLRAPAPE